MYTLFISSSQPEQFANLTSVTPAAGPSGSTWGNPQATSTPGFFGGRVDSGMSQIQQTVSCVGCEGLGWGGGKCSNMVFGGSCSNIVFVRRLGGGAVMSCL